MGAYDDFKKVIDVVQQSDNLPLMKQLIDLQKLVGDLEYENRELKSEIQALREKFKFRGELVFRNDAYWKEEGGDGPYCPGCWDTNRNLIRVVTIPGHKHTDKQCPSCQTKVRTHG